MANQDSVQWLVQIGYRNNAGQTDIVEGMGDTKEEAVANAEENRMLPNAVKVVRGFASRRISPWEKETPIYANKETDND